MIFAGLPMGSPSVMCVLAEGASPHITTNLSRTKIASYLAERADEVGLVAIEHSTKLARSAHILEFASDLQKNLVPHVLLEPYDWMADLSVRNLQYTSSKQAMADLVRQFFGAEHVSEDEAVLKAMCLAHFAQNYSRYLRSERSCLNGRDDGEFSLSLAEPGLWRFWPQFAQSNLDSLYAELLREAVPGAPRCGEAQAISNAGFIGYKDFWQSVHELQRSGLCMVVDREIKLYAPWALYDSPQSEYAEEPRKEPNTQAVPEPAVDEIEEELHGHLRELGRIYREAKQKVVPPRFTPEEKAAVRSVIEEDVLLMDGVQRVYRGVMRDEGFLEHLAAWVEDAGWKVEAAAPTLRAIARIEDAMKKQTPLLVALGDNRGFLNKLYWACKSYDRYLRSLEAPQKQGSRPRGYAVAAPLFPVSNRGLHRSAHPQ